MKLMLSTSTCEPVSFMAWFDADPFEQVMTNLAMTTHQGQAQAGACLPDVTAHVRHARLALATQSAKLAIFATPCRQVVRAETTRRHARRHVRKRR